MRAHLLIVLILLVINLATAQSLGNKYCEDITSNVRMAKVLNGNYKFQIILDKTDTIEYEVVESNLVLLGAVKNDFLINILCAYTEYNALHMISLAKKNNVW